MTVLRGQYYQYKLLPDQFYQVIRVYSPVKIQMLELTYRFSIIRTETQVDDNFTLLTSVPENRIHGTAYMPHFQMGLASILTGDFLSGRVDSYHQATKTKAFAPTYLRVRSANHAMVTQAGLINPLILGGNLATQGRVVQAHADQG